MLSAVDTRSAETCKSSRDWFVGFHTAGIWRREQFVLDGIEAERLAHAREAPPMDRRGSELLQEIAVLRRGVALVASKSIAGILKIDGHPQRISPRLGDDRRRGDAR